MSGTQGSYDLAIAVAPDNANRIYLGGSTILSGGDWSGALYRSEITVTAASVTATNTYIGNSVHADIHTIVFTPGSASQMWVGCDGGVYRTNNATGAGDIFTSLNKGLQTLTLNYLGQHPSEDAVLFAGTRTMAANALPVRRRGSTRRAATAAIRRQLERPLSRCGYLCVRGSAAQHHGGTRYSYSDVPVPLVAGDSALFYAPLVGTPINPGAPGESEILAFGSVRPWISTNFGTAWQSIPNNTLVGDQLNDSIKCLTFASATKLYAGTMSGGVYRFDKSGANWTRTQLDTMGGASDLPLAGVVTAIAVDLADGTGNSIYITFGGSGDYRHVWHFDGTQWQQRSGSAAGAADALLDVQHNAIVVDPANPAHVYAGADIGIWRSTNGGAAWQVFSDGLPDAAVVDFKLHDPRRLLRASTYGRGAFERTLDTLPKQGVELYVRDTQLDQGRFATVNFLPDPVNQGQTVAHWRGPDIKVDTPDVNGQYQFPLGSQINFFDFVDTLNDDSQNVATHATSTITTRVYVQVHNRGVVPADNVRVMCLLANASAGLPALPVGYEANVQNGMAINTATLEDTRICHFTRRPGGFPKIAAFDLTSDKLPPPANLAGNHHFCVLALCTIRATPTRPPMSIPTRTRLQERKAAHKNLTVVQFTGTLPAPPPIVVPFRLHAIGPGDRFLTDIAIELNGYRGRVRLMVPKLDVDGDLAQLIDGFAADRDIGDFQRWAADQRALITRNQSSEQRYNKTWSKQRLADIDKVLRGGVLLVAGGGRSCGLRRIVLGPNTYHTLFLLLDRPPNGLIGEAFDLRIVQHDSENRVVFGGLELRVELQPEPPAPAAKPESRGRAKRPGRAAARA